MKDKLFLALVWLPHALLAQEAGAVASLARSATSIVRGTGSSGINPVAATKVKNRARVLGGEVSGGRVLYATVTDADLRGKSPEEALRLLSPKVSAASGARKVDIVIELHHPQVIRDATGEPIYIGSAIVEPTVKQVEVSSAILTAGLKIVSVK